MTPIRQQRRCILFTVFAVMCDSIFTFHFHSPAAMEEEWRYQGFILYCILFVWIKLVYANFSQISECQSLTTCNTITPQRLVCKYLLVNIEETKKTRGCRRGEYTGLYTYKDLQIGGLISLLYIKLVYSKFSRQIYSLSFWGPYQCLCFSVSRGVCLHKSLPSQPRRLVSRYRTCLLPPLCYTTACCCCFSFSFTVINELNARGCCLWRAQQPLSHHSGSRHISGATRPGSW